jgi:hypothetical protein
MYSNSILFSLKSKNNNDFVYFFLPKDSNKIFIKTSQWKKMIKNYSINFYYNKETDNDRFLSKRCLGPLLTGSRNSRRAFRVEFDEGTATGDKG